MFAAVFDALPCFFGSAWFLMVALLSHPILHDLPFWGPLTVMQILDTPQGLHIAGLIRRRQTHIRHSILDRKADCWQ
jgi:hypothetical protein